MVGQRELAEQDDPKRDGTGGVPADEIRAVLLEAADEIGELTLYKLEETLAATLTQKLVRLSEETPESGLLDGKEFDQLIAQVRSILPTIPSRSSALRPLGTQLMETLNAMRNKSAAN